MVLAPLEHKLHLLARDDYDVERRRAQFLAIAHDRGAIWAGDDQDDDGISDDVDNCPVDANGSQVDSDGDGLGDACDALADLDADGVSDRFDPDIDGDGVLDVVDDDDDGDGVMDSQDWSTADPAGYSSPTAFAALLQSLENN